MKWAGQMEMGGKMVEKGTRGVQVMELMEMDDPCPAHREPTAVSTPLLLWTLCQQRTRPHCVLVLASEPVKSGSLNAE